MLFDQYFCFNFPQIQQMESHGKTTNVCVSYFQPFCQVSLIYVFTFPIVSLNVVSSLSLSEK